MLPEESGQAGRMLVHLPEVGGLIGLLPLQIHSILQEVMPLQDRRLLPRYYMTLQVTGVRILIPGRTSLLVQSARMPLAERGWQAVLTGDTT